jgi:hypothetical protein
VRFGRKSRDEEPEAALDAEPEEAATDAPPVGGPWDASEIADLDERDGIDLGSLVITPSGPMEMRLQVDEQSGQVIAAVLVDEHGALELRAFAAARGTSAWDELRPQIAAETARMGGTADDEDGIFGTELVCVVPIQGPDGRPTTQVSRVSGHEGPNWLLRATLMGQPAEKPDPGGPWVETIRSIVVRRGREAMAPGSPLPLTLPTGAQPIE